MRVLMTALLMCGAVASVGAQSAVTIDPGMNLDQVITKLGEPASVRTYEGHTYLYYKNGCEKTCGMSDLVVLDSGKVVDAVFRAPSRRYSGTSSSPRMLSMDEAKRGTSAAGQLALPAGDAAAKDSMRPAEKADSMPVDKAEPKPGKTEEKKLAPASKKTTKAARSSKAAAPAINLPTVASARVPGLTKTPASAPAKTAAAPEKKTEAAPAEVKETKPDTSATKKDSTKKAPAKPPAGHEG